MAKFQVTTYPVVSDPSCSDWESRNASGTAKKIASQTAAGSSRTYGV
jgi:hypothetical protein